jgi:hypothetical protein
LKEAQFTEESWCPNGLNILPRWRLISNGRPKGLRKVFAWQMPDKDFLF